MRFEGKGWRKEMGFFDSLGKQQVPVGLFNMKDGESVYTSRGLYHRSGDVIYGPDGRTYSKIGNMIQCSDGTRQFKTGSMLQTSEGTNFFQNGDTIHGSDSSLYNRTPLGWNESFPSGGK